MKPTELRQMGDEQLSITLTDTEKHLFQLRFQSATDRLETPSEIQKARADIARIRTEQRARQLKAEAALPDDQLTAKAVLAAQNESAPGVPFRGRRKATRVIKRVGSILSTRAAAKAKADRATKGNK
jgi:large subunit ribosomal protein L29